MRSTAVSVVLVAVCLSLAVVLHSASARPSSGDEFRLNERQAIAELASRILTIAANPAPSPVFDSMPTSKRNAELINSLLGIPKAMNEAGRR